MQVMPQAAARNVTVLMETHDDWSNTPAVRAVVEQANHPNLAVLWDCMHPQRMMETVEESWANIGHMTKHVHAHDSNYDVDGKLTATPLNEGLFDHLTPWRLLDSAGFDGYFSIEVIQPVGSGKANGEAILAQYAEGFASIAKQAAQSRSKL